MSLTFFAENNAANETLWVSDGTAAGTHQIASFGNHAIDNLVMIGARVYFTVSDGVHGEELWVSDGTTAGTTMVLDINPGPGDSFPFALSNIDGMLFFAASDGTHGKEPWVSDGTAAGTFLLKDIDPGGLNGFAGGSFTNINGSAFFDAVDPTHGLELWKSDGTAAGTVMVKDINPGSVGSGPSFLTNVNGTLFFEADDGTHGQELWTSDGTDAGTVMVKDINPGPGNSFGGGFSGNVANVNGTFFFEATDGTNGVQLWKSDGTAAGTVMVKAIAPGGNSAPQNMTNVNGTLFFSADDGVHGDELWKSDGTAAGTVLVKDIWPGINGAIPPPAADFTSVGSTLFFLANDGVHGYELWKSDGTDAGTMMVKDINPTGDSIPQRLVDVNGVLEFYATDGTAYGLWQSDGTAAGTVEIATHIDLNSPIGFAPQPLANDLNGDHLSDILWRNPSGGLADWSMVGGAITSGSLLTAGGAVVAPDASWSVAGISDFNGDSNADILWRSDSGAMAEWLMNGTTIMQSVTPNSNGAPVSPDASWTPQARPTIG